MWSSAGPPAKRPRDHAATPAHPALDQVDARNRAWADGYAAGYTAGREVGYEAAEWEMWRGKAAWLAGAKVGTGPLDNNPASAAAGFEGEVLRRWNA